MWNSGSILFPRFRGLHFVWRMATLICCFEKQKSDAFCRLTPDLSSFMFWKVAGMIC